MANNAALFTATLDPTGFKQHFYSFEDARKWLTSEQDVWEWMNSAYRRDTELSDSIRVQNQVLTDLINTATRWETDPSPSAKATGADDLKSKMDSTLGVGKAIYSASPPGQFILAMKDKNPRSAAFAFAYLINNPRVINHSLESIAGTLDAHLFRSGYKASIETERGALTALRNEWQNVASTNEAEIRVLKAEVATLRAVASNLIANQKSSFEELVSAQQKKLDDMFEISRSECTAIERRFVEEMSLKAPVRFWRHRQQRHSAQAKRFGCAAGVLAFLLIVFEIVASTKVTWEKLPPPWLIVGSFLAVWALRILIRLLLSNMHLGSDAEERETMVRTYLALIKGETLGKEEDRQLILKALFRRSIPGPAPDDAAPLAEVTQIVKK